MSRSTKSASHFDEPALCRVVIDICTHSEALGVDYGELKSHLSDLTSDITISKSICAAPSRLATLIKDDPSKGVVVIGYGDRVHTTKYRNVDTASIPPQHIEVVDLRLINAYRKNYDAFTSTVNLHIAKATTGTADLPFQPKHRPFKLSKTVSRRHLFRAATATLTEYTDHPVYQEQLCTTPLKSCTRCTDACPYGAVIKSQSTITIDDEGCVRCGACCTACPTGALQTPYLSDRQMIAILEAAASKDGGQSDQKSLVFTCDQGVEVIVRKNNSLPQSAGVIQIPCVSTLSFLHYLLAASFNIDLLALCPNNHCKTKETLTFSRNAATIVTNILNNVKQPSPTVRLIEPERIDSVRQLLNRALTSKPTVRSRVPSLDQSSRRSLLTTALLETASEVDGIFGGIASPFFSLSIDTDTCTLCDACSKICPEYALGSIADESAVSLMFIPRRCVGCNACEEICPEHALKVVGSFNPQALTEDQKVLKVKDGVVTCKRCGAYLGPTRKIQRVEETLNAKGMAYMKDTIHLCGQCKVLI